EDQARKAKSGLWALPESDRMPPWEWRKAGRDQRKGQRDSSSLTGARSGTAGRSAVGGSAGGSSYSCSTPKTCGQMSSCAEAQFHLNECGNGRLDGDKDGVPCESLCR